MKAAFRAELRGAVVLYAFRLLAGFLVAYPFARTLTSFGPSTSPYGDRTLFAPGGWLLLEALRLGSRAVTASLESASVAIVLLSIAGLLPLAFVVGLISDPGARGTDLVRRATERFPILAFVAGVVILVQALVVVGTSVLLAHAIVPLGTLFDEPGSDLCLALIAASGAAMALGAGVLHDVASIAVVRNRASAGEALTAGFRAMAVRPRSIFFSWGSAVLAAAAAIGVAAWLTGRIDVSRPGVLRILGVLATHQLAAFALAIVRMRWLGDAARVLEGPLGV